MRFNYFSKMTFITDKKVYDVGAWVWQLLQVGARPLG